MPPFSVVRRDLHAIAAPTWRTIRNSRQSSARTAPAHAV
jgi:hypothetical protein